MEYSFPAVVLTDEQAAEIIYEAIEQKELFSKDPEKWLMSVRERAGTKFTPRTKWDDKERNHKKYS